MSKQDRQGVRTPADLEQKYQFGKTFAEFMGIANDTRTHVDNLESSLRSEIQENVTAITRNTEQIILTALEGYAKVTDTEDFKQALTAELAIMAERIALNFESAMTQITEVDGKVQTVNEELSKHFEFGVDGLTIKSGESQIKLRIDNDMVAFYKGDIDETDLSKNRFSWWDGENFHTGNIYVSVDETAQFGNYGFVPYYDVLTDGLDLVRVGE